VDTKAELLTFPDFGTTVAQAMLLPLKGRSRPQKSF